MQVELEALKKKLFQDNQVRNIKFYPGLLSDSQPDDMAREVNKFFADPTDERDGEVEA